MPDDASLHELAGAIVDGSSVDWSAAESDGEASVREVIRELKVIAGIAGVHASASLPSDGAQTSPDPAGADDTSARIWGPLRLLEKIGEGAYGEVFRAWDTRLDREVALKLLAAGRASARTTSSIVHEGRLLARVRHPNVVTIYGAETIDNRVGLWMELVRGRTLEQILKEGTLFSAAEATRIGIDICRAVSAVHGAGLLHRDIKAHNVMLADDGRVVLMDFGTGQEIQAGSSIELAGTPVYLAPEVLFGNPATIQSDIYSIGVLLFHLLSGSYPVQGRSTPDVRRAHEENARVSLRTARPDVPASLVAVIDRALDPQPARRYESAAALGAGLLADGPRARTNRRLVGLAAFGLIALALGLFLARGGWFVSSGSDSQASRATAGHLGARGCAKRRGDPQTHADRECVGRRHFARRQVRRLRRRSGRALKSVAQAACQSTAASKSCRPTRCGTRNRPSPPTAGRCTSSDRKGTKRIRHFTGCRLLVGCRQD